MTAGIAAVVLAAGSGTRLRPLTDLLPKALCPVDGEPLADGAVRRCRSVTDAVAINAHALGAQIVEHFWGSGIHVSVERREALGTAGALGALRGWIDGRDVLVHNADVWHDADLGDLAAGWDGVRMRLLTVERERSADFGRRLYAGACLIPWSIVQHLRAEPSGLYEVLWARAAEHHELDFTIHRGRWFDCGTPSSYLAANLAASGGRAVIAPTAEVGEAAQVVRSVVWPGAVVAPGERLFEVIRAGDASRPLTVSAPQ